MTPGPTAWPSRSPSAASPDGAGSCTGVSNRAAIDLHSGKRVGIVAPGRLVASAGGHVPTGTCPQLLGPVPVYKARSNAWAQLAPSSAADMMPPA